MCRNSRQSEGYGTNGSEIRRWGADNRLHKFGCVGEGVSVGEGQAGLGGDGKDQQAAKRLARTRGDVLRHRTGVVHASIATRGTTMSAGRDSMVSRTGEAAEGHR